MRQIVDFRFSFIFMFNTLKKYLQILLDASVRIELSLQTRSGIMLRLMEGREAYLKVKK